MTEPKPGASAEDRKLAAEINRRWCENTHSMNLDFMSDLIAAYRVRLLRQAVKHRVLRTDLVGWFGCCSCGAGGEIVDFETEQDWLDHIAALGGGQ